jgi:hypothetical protein
MPESSTEVISSLVSVSKDIDSPINPLKVNFIAFPSRLKIIYLYLLTSVVIFSGTVSDILISKRRFFYSI